MTQDDFDLFAARGFGKTIGFGQSPAVVVIDMINAFTDHNLPLGSDLEPQIKATLELLQQVRKLDIPLFFTTVAYEDNSLADAGIWASKMSGLMTLRAGSKEVEIDSRLNRKPNESVITKKYASAFFGTDLLSRINSLRVDTLIITGCTTSGCVRATAVDAVQNGIRPIVIEEAVGDRSESAHSQSLFDLQAKYADVISLQHAIDYLETINR